MVFGLILLICVIVLLAFFIGKNITNVCTIWFFHTYTDLPVYMLALVAFASGAIVAVLFFLIGKLKGSSEPKQKQSPAEKSAKDKINKKKSLLKKAEKAAKKSDNDSDATIVADTSKLGKK